MTKESHNTVLGIINSAYGFDESKTASTMSKLLDYPLIKSIHLESSQDITGIEYDVITEYETHISILFGEIIDVTPVLPGEHCKVVIRSLQSTQEQVQISAVFTYTDNRQNTVTQSFTVPQEGGDALSIVARFFRKAPNLSEDPTDINYEYWDDRTGWNQVNFEFDGNTVSKEINICTSKDLQVRQDGNLLTDLTLANMAGYQNGSAYIAVYLYTPNPTIFSYDGGGPENLKGSEPGKLLFLNALTSENSLPGSNSLIDIYINLEGDPPGDGGDGRKFVSLDYNEYSNIAFDGVNQSHLISVYRQIQDGYYAVYRNTFNPYTDETQIITFIDPIRTGSIRVLGIKDILLFRPKRTHSECGTGGTGTGSIQTEANYFAPHVSDFQLPDFLK